MQQTTKTLNKIASANPAGNLVTYRELPKHKSRTYDHVDRIQKYGTVRYQQLETKALNKVQQRLYSETVYGLNYFTEKQLTKLSQSDRHRITLTFKKVQRILNRWKQQVVSQTVDSFLLALFPRSPIVKQFVSLPCIDDEYTDTHSFKELGISQVMIAEKLIKHGLLPNNFFQLA